MSSTAKSSGRHNNTHKSSSITSKSSQRRSKSMADNDIPMMTKKVRISQEKLLALTRKAYNNSGADNKCEAKSLHLLCRVVNAQFTPSGNNNQSPNSLCTLQSKFEDKFNPSSEAWKHAFILVISFLKKYQMELSLATVIVETPKEIEVRNYSSPGFTKIPFPISLKHFSSPDSVSRIFNDLMRTKKSIQKKSFNDKLNEFIESMEMEDFWQRNPLLVFSNPYANTLSTVQTERSSAQPTEQKLSSVNIIHHKNKSLSSQNIVSENVNNDEAENINNDEAENVNNDEAENDDINKEKISSDSRKKKKKKNALSSSSTKKGTKKKKKSKKKDE